MKILVTGTTGYIGGRLVPRLLKKGYHVKATARSLSKLQGRSWSNHPNIELVASNVLDYASTLRAAQGCDVAYYLVHSMERGKKAFEEVDRNAALNFVAASEAAGVKRLIYLGGLGSEQDHLSRHLQSRREVGQILKNSKIPVTILRAAMIIGAGSASFEILRYLVEHLPIMITPRWVRTAVQPIAIINVLYYLIALLEKEETIGQTYDIGGPQVTTYQELMDLYAEIAGLRRRVVIPVRVLSPWLSSHWIGLVTPLPSSLGKPLVEGLSNTVVCEDFRIREIIPQELLNLREVMKRAIDRLHHDEVETSWNDADIVCPAEWFNQADPMWAGGTLFEDIYTAVIDDSPKKVWQTILKVGGETGWYSPNWLWKIRGWIDKLVGGVGLARGRRNTSHLQVGDVVDFWRVYHLEPYSHFVLVAEMKLPGQAALEFRLQKRAEEKTELSILARFLPRGLSGRCYWYFLFPFHGWIFKSMLKKISENICKEIKEGS